MAVQPRLAATVMVLRNDSAGQGIEVFMVRRVVQSEFMPDVYVFPGGSASADDVQAEQTEGICVPVTSSAADPEGRTRLGSGVRAAAIRELFEEANVLLAYHNGAMLAVSAPMVARFAHYRELFNTRKGSLIEMARNEQLVLATDRLAYCAHWITPEIMPKRYDTHFFLAVAPAEQEAMYDHLETSDGIWIQPASALQRYEAGKFPIAFPTFHQLRDLAQFQSVEQALQVAETRYVPTRRPLVSRKDGSIYVSLPEEPERLWKAQ
jgi:8-oxo-dGTP pyrophosphatase MutT (NUDIX family)